MMLLASWYFTLADANIFLLPGAVPNRVDLLCTLPIS